MSEPDNVSWYGALVPMISPFAFTALMAYSGILDTWSNVGSDKIDDLQFTS